jgi:hypothetical protein
LGSFAAQKPLFDVIDGNGLRQSWLKGKKRREMQIAVN